MKTKHLLTVIFTMSFLTGMAQYTDKDGVEVKACDCGDPIAYLDYTVTMPANYRSYDVIQFVAYRNGAAIAGISVRPSAITDGKMKLNLLNDANKAKRTLLGREYGRYHGNDLSRVSYNALCDDLTKEAKLVIVAFGYRQVGTETTYEITSSNKIKASSVDLYDNGEKLVKSAGLSFKQM